MPVRLTLLLLAVLLQGCSSGPGAGERLRLEVDGETATCTGVGERQCLKVRAPGDEDWQLFYSPIEGFDFEPGFRVVLEVDRSRIDNSPADASAFRYRLVRVVAREPLS